MLSIQNSAYVCAKYLQNIFKRIYIMLTNKEKLIQDIQNLLNSYGEDHKTNIDPNLLEFMDEKTLINIIDSMLNEKEKRAQEPDTEWLEQFKQQNN